MVARRTELNLTQIDLAKKLALHGWKTDSSAISRWENGKRLEWSNDPTKVDAMRRALDVHSWVVYFCLGRIPPEIHVPAENAQIEIGLALLATALGKIDTPGCPKIAYDAAKRIHLIDIGDGRDAERLTDRMALQHGAEMLDGNGAQTAEKIARAIETDDTPVVETVAEPASEDIW